MKRYGGFGVAALVAMLASACVETSLPQTSAPGVSAPATDTRTAITTVVGTGASAFAGMTCVGYYNFGLASQADYSKAAIWFQPDQAGKADLFVRLGREAMENYDKVASPQGYDAMGPVQIVQQGAVVRFKTATGVLYTLTNTGASNFYLERTGQGYTWYGKVACRSR